MTKDLTAGSPIRLMISFTVSMVLGSLFQQVYSITDTAIVGHVLGTGALAAVGSTSSVTFLAHGFTGGLCNGFAIPVARTFGSGDHSRLRQYVGNSIWLCLFFAAAITVPALLLCGNILHWMHTPPDILADAHAYLFMVFAGMPFVVLYSLASSMMRAFGDSRTPLVFLVLSTVLNVGLDLFFLLGMHSGVWGAALATVISQALCGVFSLLALQARSPELFPFAEDFRPQSSLMRELCWAGLPMGLESSLTGIGAILLSASINSLGSTVVASITAGNKVSQILLSPLSNFSVVMAIYASQNLGAGRFDRIRRGMRSALLTSASYAVFAFGANLLLGRYALLLFLSAQQTAVIEGARQFLFWNTLVCVSLGFSGLFRCALQGMGYSAVAMLSGAAEMITRSVMSFTLIPALGAMGAYLANPVAWSVSAAFLAILYALVLPHVCKRMRSSQAGAIPVSKT